MPLKPYNNESLNLEILAEEAAEVIQIKSKVVRFGLTDYHPKNEVPNRQALEREIGHFLVMVDILVEHGTITEEGIAEGMAHKLRRMPDWYFADPQSSADIKFTARCNRSPAERLSQGPPAIPPPQAYTGSRPCATCHPDICSLCESPTCKERVAAYQYENIATCQHCGVGYDTAEPHGCAANPSADCTCQPVPCARDCACNNHV